MSSEGLETAVKMMPSINNYRSSYAEVVVVFACAAALILHSFCHEKKVQTILRKLLPSLIFVSIQSIVSFVVSIVLYRHFAGLSSNSIGEMLSSLLLQKHLEGVSVMICWLIFWAFIALCMIAIPTSFRAISPRIHAANFVIISSLFLVHLIDISVNSMNDGNQVSVVSIAVASLASLVYFVFALFDMVLKRISSGQKRGDVLENNDSSSSDSLNRQDADGMF